MWPIISKARKAVQLACRIDSRHFSYSAATPAKHDPDKPLSAYAWRYRNDSEYRESETKHKRDNAAYREQKLAAQRLKYCNDDEYRDRQLTRNRLRYRNDDEYRERLRVQVAQLRARKSTDKEWRAQELERRREYSRTYRQTPAYREGQQQRREYARTRYLKQKEARASAAAAVTVASVPSQEDEMKANAQRDPLPDKHISPTHQPRTTPGSVTDTSPGNKRCFSTFGKAAFSTRHFSTCARDGKASDGEHSRQPLSAWQIKYRNDPEFRQREKERYAANYSKNADYRETHLQQIRESVAQRQQEDPSFYRKRQSEYRVKRRKEDPEWGERINAYQREFYWAKKRAAAAAAAATAATGGSPEDSAQSSAQNAARDAKQKLSPVKNNHTRAQHSSSGMGIFGGKRRFSMLAGTGLLSRFSTSTKACKDPDDGKLLSQYQIQYRTDLEFRERAKRRSFDRYHLLATDQEFREKRSRQVQAALAKRLTTEEGFRQKYLAKKRAALAKRFETEEGFRQKYLVKKRAAGAEYRRRKREAQALATVASPLKSLEPEKQHSRVENTSPSNVNNVNISSSSFHSHNVLNLPFVNPSSGSKRPFSTLHFCCKESSLGSSDWDCARKDARNARNARRRERYATDPEY